MNFVQARLKIERADHHFDKLEARIMALHETDHSEVKVDPKTGEEILIHDFADPAFFQDAALLLGDAVHNLKCALDYTWLETISRVAPTLVDDHAKFPARKDIKEVKGWLESERIQVDRLRPSLHEFMLDKICPHAGWEYAIRPIHTMDNRDKHRLLIPVLSKGHIEGIEVEDEAGERHMGDGYSVDLQKPPYCIRYRRGLHVTCKGKLTVEIMIEDADSGDGLPILGLVTGYSYYIRHVVKLFEAFLEMEGF